MNQINERIKHIIEAKSENITDFSLKTDIAPTTIKNIIGKRQSIPTVTIIIKICKKFPDISLDWLIMGRGEPFKEG